MEKDKVESRTDAELLEQVREYVLIHFSHYLEGNADSKGKHHSVPATHFTGLRNILATRPSVPQQGQAFREMYTISTNGSYYTRNSDGKLFTLIADVAEDYAAHALAASRSEAQPPRIQLDTAVRNLAEDIGRNFVLAKGDQWREQVEWIHTHIKELVDFAAGAPAAGSAERVAIKAIAEAWKNGDIGCPQSLDTHFEAPAGTDTDVAKEK